MRQTIIDFGNHFGVALKVYGYGLMLVLGFLLSIALAQWRAKRMGENPEVLARCGLLAVIGGILGARIAFVIQHSEDFVGKGDFLVNALNVTSGGLIYYGGVVLAILMVLVYLLIKKLPVRRYLDILAVSMMVGLAFGRAGCLLNGCCYGANCDKDFELGMSFPMYSKPLLKVDGGPGPFPTGVEHPSPVYDAQFAAGQILPDQRLMYANQPGLDGHWALLSPREFHAALSNDQLAVSQGPKEEARQVFLAASHGHDRMTRQDWHAAWSKGDGFLRGSEVWEEAILYDRSQDDQSISFDAAWAYLQARDKRVAAHELKTDVIDTPQGRQKVNAYLQADLYALAMKEHSLPVKPSQALGIINALVLAGLLAFFFRLRSREGQVFAMVLIMYPITRFIEELIRHDNPHDLVSGILTHNQYTSMILIVVGCIILAVLRMLPPSAGPTWAQNIGVFGSTSSARKPK